MRSPHRLVAALAVVFPLFVAACGDDGGTSGLQQDGAITSPDLVEGDAADAATSADSATPADTATAGTDTANEPSVTIIVEGDLEDRSPDDGLSAQTPKVYRYGLQRLELLRSADDPSPEVIFDYAPDYVVVDMLDRQIVANVPMRTLPTGPFPYFRIVLTHMEAVVDARLHQVPVVGDWPAELHLLYALSDVDNAVYTMNQGDAVVSTEILGNPVSVPTHWDLPAPNPSPAATAAAVDGEWQVTFAVAPVLVPSPDTPFDVTYVIRYFVTNGFRWQDLDTPGYTAGAWDLTVSTPPAMEPVQRFGANAFDVYMEIP